MKEQIELRDGDIYRWSWVNPPEHEPYYGKQSLCLGRTISMARVVD